MGSAKPTLGYPSRTAAVLALRAQRLSTRQIAQRIGIRESTVSALENSAARPRRDRPSEYLARTVVIPNDVLDALAPHAAKRNMTVNAMVRLLVEIISDDGMVDAIIDDREHTNG